VLAAADGIPEMPRPRSGIGAVAAEKTPRSQGKVGTSAACRASKWLFSAAELHRVMQAVCCVGGETQIERVLSNAIRETRARKVNALVFVGDAMEEKLDRLARLAGELGTLGVPIFAFHEGDVPDVQNHPSLPAPPHQP
jgi:hypothetical protein